MPHVLPNDAAAGCTAYFSALEGDIKQFKSLMQRTVGDARHASVLPGTIREVLRSNRLEFDWER